MIAKVFSKTRAALAGREGRSTVVATNSALLLSRKFISVGISYWMVPILLSLLGVEKYGLWATIGAMIGWFYLFDFGLALGLQNEITRSLTAGAKIQVQALLSTGYFAMIIVSLVVMTLFIIGNQTINWSWLLNVRQEILGDLKNAIVISVSFFCIQFVLRLVGTLLIADQKSAVQGYFSTAGSIITLALLVGFYDSIKDSLAFVAVIIGISNLIPIVIATVVLYGGIYKPLRPSIKAIEFRSVGRVISSGWRFLIIQISAVIVYTTDSLLITNMLGPEDVAPYAIAFKYMSVVLIFVTVVLKPMWAAYSQAYAVRDIAWIIRITRRLIKGWFGVLALSVIMVVASPFVYDVWLGPSLYIPYTLTLLMALHMAILTWSQIFGNFINGAGHIRLQLYLAIYAAIVNIPLSIFLCLSMKMGSEGVIVATILSNIPIAVILPIQFKKIVEDRASGIWSQ